MYIGCITHDTYMDRIPRQCVQYVKNTYFAQKTKELIVNDKMQQRNSIQTKQHINTQNTVLPTLGSPSRNKFFGTTSSPWG